MFRSFSVNQRIFGVGFLLLAWSICSFILWKMDGTAVIFDGLTLVLGIVVPILNIIAYIEAPALNIISVAAQVILWIQIVCVDGKLHNLTYLIYMTYALYMTTRTFLRWAALYREQHSLDDKEKRVELVLED